ncbi:hypothetical protein Leucomu_10655 [Leucobacter muris]|uniref:ImmA/IrrE family metallo-endopeptidase n=1 Tax=Leucobacter muris TaxID=1935379 RepID=A0ABX5QH84_9MICO|nr:hypothetical protein [Leucobacter muris]QAB18315.1 hypothetical protein Leucomu_10655 [Leucobacter muris]
MTSSMPARQMAEELVANLGCRPGSSLEDIQERVALFHQKEIALHPVDDVELRNITGLWVETELTSHVFFRNDDPKLYQTHSIFHEFGHIIADHSTCGVLSFIDNTLLGTAPLGGQIQRARARGFNQDEDETLAEEIAYALSRLVIAGSAVGIRAVFE